MPLYDYECACGSTITLNRSIANRDKLVDVRCTNCNQDNKFKRQICSPMIVSGVAGRLRTTDSFNDRLKEVQKKVSRYNSEPLNDIIR